MLEARSLALGYDATPVVSDVSLRIPPGRMTALVGRNGCGKSTLLRGLARLLPPRGGAVVLDGADIARLPTREVARRLGMLPQGPTAPEGLTVRDLVAQGRFPHQGWLRQWSAHDAAAVAEALARTAMTELAGRPLDTLSGGQRQKAWIATALAQETALLLLDEPTTFLDLAHQLEVLELLADLDRAGRHDGDGAARPEPGCRYAHHLVAMKAGRIVAEGDPSVIMSEALVREVFGVACRIVPDPVAGTPWCVPIGRVPAPD